MNDIDKNQEINWLLNLLEEDVTKKKIININEIPNSFFQKLEERQIIALGSSKIKNQIPKIEYWLKSRIFEHIITYHGLKEYLTDILQSDSKSPEMDIGFNGHFILVYLLASIKDDLNKKIVNNKKLNLSKNEKDLIHYILTTPREYDLKIGDLKFQPFKISEIRSQLSNLLITNSSLLNRIKLIDIKIPDDLNEIKDLDLSPSDKNLILISKKYNNLKIILFKEYIIFYYEKKPTLYLKNSKLYYSENELNKTKFLKKDLISQVNFIKNLFSKKKIIPKCTICNHEEIKFLAYNDFQSIGICEHCINKAKDEKLEIRKISLI